MLKSISVWWKSQFGDGTVTYQEDASVQYRNSYVVVVFPDGYEVEVNPFQYQKYINNGTLVFDTWKPPMTELFLLCVKDRKLWEKYSYLGIGYKHKVLGIIIRWYEETRANLSTGITYHNICKVEGVSLSDKELNDVVNALQLYTKTPKFERLERIKVIRNQRLDNLTREAEAQRIRNYLENK